MNELEGLAKTIYEEVMDEIKEEIGEGLGDVIAVEKLKAITIDIQKTVKEKITKLIVKHTKDDMTDVEKMILGEPFGEHSSSSIIAASSSIQRTRSPSPVIHQVFPSPKDKL